MLKTGFQKLDEVIGGLKDQECVVLASRPGVGKSTIALDIINHVLHQTKEKILYFNLETSKEYLQEKIKNDSVEIIDIPKITIEEIKDRCKDASTTGLALVVIDYIQLIYPTGFQVDVAKTIEHISKTLKEIAIECNIPILVLSEISRQFVEREKEEKFHLALQESSPLLQIVDKVVFLYKESYDKQTEEHNKDIKEVKVLEDDIVVAIL